MINAQPEWMLLQNSRPWLSNADRLGAKNLNPRVQGSHVTFDGGILTELQELLLAHHPILRQVHRLKPGSFQQRSDSIKQHLQ